MAAQTSIGGIRAAPTSSRADRRRLLYAFMQKSQAPSDTSESCHFRTCFDSRWAARGVTATSRAARPAAMKSPHGIPSPNRDFLETDANASSSDDGGIDSRELQRRAQSSCKAWINYLKVGRKVEPGRQRRVIVHLDGVLVL